MAKDLEENFAEDTSPLYMVNKKLWLIFGLLVSLIIVFILFTVYMSGYKTPPPQNKQEAPKTTLMLENPAQTEENPGSNSWENKITLSTNKTVTGVQLELTYDPTHLKNVDIKPGDFIQDAVVLLKKIDPVNGRITYALGIAPGKQGIKGEGNVATITFTESEKSASDFSIKFLPETQVAALGISKSVLDKAIDNKFTLGHPHEFEKEAD